MKIIERGNTSEIINCYKCKSKLEIEANDIRSGKFGCLGDYDTEYYIICPVCEERIVLKEKDHLTVQIYIRQSAK